MSLVIETTDDFIRALRENEEFQAAARRELLTQDLLELPKEFKEFKEDTAKEFDSIAKQFDSINNNLERLNVSVADIRGASLESKMPTRLRQRLAAELHLTTPRTLWLAEHYVQPPSRAEEFEVSRERAVDQSQITADESERLIDTDMVIQATSAQGDRIHVAVEASGVIGRRDIDRARESANILKKMFGGDSIAAVYGFSIEPVQIEQAREKEDMAEVHVFLETGRF